MEQAEQISIHALCEEGDPFEIGDKIGMRKFLSTPSARRATEVQPEEEPSVEISIHALCEEGDLILLWITC